jgi:hypothetical protein
MHIAIIAAHGNMKSRGANATNEVQPSPTARAEATTITGAAAMALRGQVSQARKPAAPCSMGGAATGINDCDWVLLVSTDQFPLNEEMLLRALSGHAAPLSRSPESRYLIAAAASKASVAYVATAPGSMSHPYAPQLMTLSILSAPVTGRQNALRANETCALPGRSGL